MLCGKCGSQNPHQARFCFSCGAALSATAPRSPGNAVAGFAVARLGDRLLAVILDTALLGAAFVVSGMWIAAHWGGVTPSGFEMTGTPALATLAIVVVVGLLYYWLSEGILGATLGKAAVGVAVCDAEGRRCGLGRSLIRNVLRIVDGLALYLVGFVVAVFSKKRQRLGDHMASTYVVEKGVGKPGRLFLAFLWLAALAAGIWGSVVIHRSAPAPDVTTAVEATDTSRVAVAPLVVATPSAAPILVSGDLELADFAFLQSEDGPPRSPAPFKPRERLFAAFKATGLTTDEQGRIHLQYGIEAFDANGLLVKKLTKELHGAPGSSNVATISVWVDIPVFIPPGGGKLRVTAHDDVKNTDGEIVAPFVVEAPPPAISRQLEIRGLRFSLSEDGPPLDPPVIGPGTTLYVSGELAGMQFQDDRIDVGLAFRVIGPEGNVILDKPGFLDVKDFFTYHPSTFYVPITAHLRLPADVPKGTYKERYIVTDRIGGANKTYELTFKLE
jgi:uncharacterized RDD family membrane protein YckC